MNIPESTLSNGMLQTIGIQETTQTPTTTKKNTNQHKTSGGGEPQPPTNTQQAGGAPTNTQQAGGGGDHQPTHNRGGGRNPTNQRSIIQKPFQPSILRCGGGKNLHLLTEYLIGGGESTNNHFIKHLSRDSRYSAVVYEVVRKCLPCLSSHLLVAIIITNSIIHLEMVDLPSTPSKKMTEDPHMIFPYIYTVGTQGLSLLSKLHTSD
jgi:hypothetical protein